MIGATEEPDKKGVGVCQKLSSDPDLHPEGRNECKAIKWRTLLIDNLLETNLRRVQFMRMTDIE
ncbi:unnamed protein product [Clavelina lepadiformis]|uniref:Uncharacterized protein n=1 Tax=Clavelina lepadiformis TaxID=159417 RepID=A0ABP0FX22_CLALP